MPWQFHVIADLNLINAFALPGGHVFIGRGLLDQMNKSRNRRALLFGRMHTDNQIVGWDEIGNPLARTHPSLARF